MKKALKISVWASLVFASAAARGAFLAGTISVVQVGDGATAFAGNVAQNVSIVTYNIASGLPVGTVALTGSVLDSKNDDADGHLSFTGNGQYLTLGAYAGVAGGAYPVTSTAARQVIRVDGGGNVATASFSGIYAGQAVVAVASADGNSFFMAGGNDTTGTGGLRYVSGLGAASTVNVSRTQTGANADSYRNIRIVGGINGSLYANTASQGSFTNRGVYSMTIGGALPTATVATASTATPIIVNTEGSLTDASGNVSPDTTGKVYPKTDSAFIDTNDDGVFDTAYSTGGKEELEKWILTGGKWVRTDTIDAPAVTIAGQNNEINAIDYTLTPSGVELFLSNDFGVWKFTDSGGAGGIVSSDFASGTDSNVRRYLGVNYFISAGANEQLRGIAVTPVAVPEPTGLGLAAVAAGMVTARRRRA